MKIFKTICLILVLFTVLQAGLFPVSSMQADADKVSGCHSTDAAKPLMSGDQLLETAKAVFVYERNSDTLVYGYNPDQALDPAGMPKVMTALIAIEKGNLDDMVTVSKKALDAVAIGSVSAGLVRGEEISLKDLLYLMMTKSANDAATVIAEHIAGSQEAFVEMMNQRAGELGCTNTVFTNAHGLPDEASALTARDLCRILDTALDDETFRALFSATEYTVPATNKSEAREIETSNKMALQTSKTYYDSRVTGGKTGATKDGRYLAVTAEHNGMELLAIVMGAVPTYEVENIVIKTYGSFEEMAVLLDHVCQRYEYRQVFYNGQAVSQHSVTNGSGNVVLSPTEAMSTVLPVDLDPSQLSWVYGDLTGSTVAPIQKGQHMSTLQVWYGNICVAETDLVAMFDVPVYEKPNDTDHSLDTQTNTGWLGTVIWIVLGLIAAVLLGMVGVRAIRRAMIKSRRKRRRREQRRRGHA